MELTNEQVQAAVRAGLALTDPDSDATVPMRHAGGALILRSIMAGMAEGKLGLSTVMQEEEPSPDTDQE